MKALFRKLAEAEARVHGAVDRKNEQASKALANVIPDTAVLMAVGGVKGAYHGVALSGLAAIVASGPVGAAVVGVAAVLYFGGKSVYYHKHGCTIEELEIEARKEIQKHIADSRARTLNRKTLRDALLNGESNTYDSIQSSNEDFVKVGGVVERVVDVFDIRRYQLAFGTLDILEEDAIQVEADVEGIQGKKLKKAAKETKELKAVVKDAKEKMGQLVQDIQTNAKVYPQDAAQQTQETQVPVA